MAGAEVIYWCVGFGILLIICSGFSCRTTLKMSVDSTRRWRCILGDAQQQPGSAFDAILEAKNPTYYTHGLVIQI